MIGDEGALKMASEIGLLRKILKPVVYYSIEKALNTQPAADVSSAAAAVREVLATSQSSGPTVAVPTNLFEVEPYHAILPNLPLNTFKNKAPHTGSIISVKRIVGTNAPGEVCHVHIKSGKPFKYWEGQSLGIIPPGEVRRIPAKKRRERRPQPLSPSFCLASTSRLAFACTWTRSCWPSSRTRPHGQPAPALPVTSPSPRR